MGGTVAFWLVLLTPDREVWVQALARGTITALTVLHYTQVYKWVTAIYYCDKLWKTG